MQMGVNFYLGFICRVRSKLDWTKAKMRLQLTRQNRFPRRGRSDKACGLRGL